MGKEQEQNKILFDCLNLKAEYIQELHDKGDYGKSIKALLTTYRLRLLETGNCSLIFSQ
jgi:hypothetical protein